MGGGNKGKESEVDTDIDICQMCDCEGHTAIECQWLYSECYVSNCNSLMKLFVT